MGFKHTVLWNINVQCDNVIEARKTDIILTEKEVWKGIIINIVVPADVRLREKEKEKGEKYRDLKKERLEDCGDLKW